MLEQLGWQGTGRKNRVGECSHLGVREESRELLNEAVPQDTQVKKDFEEPRLMSVY